MEHPPKELDWVTRYAECTAMKVFCQLRREVDKDVATRNDLVTESQKCQSVRFCVQSNDAEYFTVHREGVGLVAFVSFRLSGTTIVVQDDKSQVLLSATWQLDDLGDCVLLVDGTPLMYWQVRQRALRQLFFSGRLAP